MNRNAQQMSTMHNPTISPWRPEELDILHHHCLCHACGWRPCLPLSLQCSGWVEQPFKAAQWGHPYQGCVQLPEISCCPLIIALSGAENMLVQTIAVLMLVRSGYYCQLLESEDTRKNRMYVQMALSCCNEVSVAGNAHHACVQPLPIHCGPDFSSAMLLTTIELYAIACRTCNQWTTPKCLALCCQYAHKTSYGDSVAAS